MQVIDQINGSALFAQSAYSASIATKDSLGRDITSTYLTEHQDLSNYATTGDLDSVSSFLSGAIDYVSANAGDEFPASANDAITAYQTYSGDYLTNQDISNLATKDEVSAYTLTTTLEQVSGDIVSQIPSIEGLATTGDLNSVSSFLSGAIDYVSANAGDEFPVSADEAIQYVQTNSATIDNINSTVQTNSAQWAEGTSVDTIPVAVISPLVTGFSGESAYLGIESTALNLSSYVPVSAVGVNSQGYVSGISGMNISAYYSRNSLTSNYSYTADRAYHDRNNNEITSYYQPKLTIAGSAGTITSINGSAVGASIPEGWELVAGQGIEIVDDAENNQTTISVTAAGGNPEVESYVQTNSAHIDDAVSTYQNNSGSYITQETDWTNTITAASSYAYSEAVAQIPAPFDPTYMSGAIDQNTSDIQYISGVAITALPSDLATTGDVNDLAQSISDTYQVKGDYLTNADSANFYPANNPSGFITGVDLSNYYQKNETSGATELSNAFGSIVQGDADVNSYVQTNSSDIDEVNTSYQTNSGTFLTAVNIPESASWNDATTSYQTNSATYLTSHQAISAEEWNSNYETVTTNSGAWGGSALNISAGPGISLSMVDGVLVISVTGGN